MFIRTKSTKNSPRKAVQIVESIRVGKKVKQTIIKHIGVALNEAELDELKLLAEAIKNKLEKDPQLNLFDPEKLTRIPLAQADKKSPYCDADYQVDLRNLDEESRVINGIHDIYGALFNELGLNKIIQHSSRNESATRLLKDIVLARIANPESKRSSVHLLEKNFGVSLNLDKVYRMMDKLDDKAIIRINETAYAKTRDLFGGKIDVIFFDVTTLYFESFTEDEFKRNGYSKDLKFGQPQVLLALMVTKQGLPIGYEAFSGDTFEGHTLIPTLKALRKKYDLDKVVYVADAGMFNKDNLAELDVLEAQGFNYIVGARIKNMPQAMTAQILEKAHYHAINEGLEIASFAYGNRKLIVSYSAKRAKKDRMDREKGIAKLTRKLEGHRSPKAFLSNQGYKKYLTLSGECETSILLNEKKIAEDAAWDGLKGYVINGDSHLTDTEVLEQYNNLWQVEQSFRITKHDLKIRPIYHWKPARVKAHLAISFCAYMLVRHLEYRIKLRYKALSPEKIRQTLLSIQTSILFCHKKRIRYGLPSKVSTEAIKIYQVMDVARKKQAYIIKKL